jgi:hypothetical protein
MVFPLGGLFLRELVSLTKTYVTQPALISRPALANVVVSAAVSLGGHFTWGSVVGFFRARDDVRGRIIHVGMVVKHRLGGW